MLAAANGYLRRQFYLYWPRMGRLARVTAYFAAVDLLLLAAWAVSLLVKTGGSSSLLWWVGLLAYLSLLLACLLGLRWLRRKVMWRLRNRLIVTYVFIGVIPVILLLTIGLITAYLFAWQFATYVATSDFRTEISTLGALNKRVAMEMADRLGKGAAPSEALLHMAHGPEPMYPGYEITAWYRGKAFVLPASASAAALPPDSGKELRTFALDNGRLLLRVADTVSAGKDVLVLISNVPVDEKLLARVGRDLGEVSLSIFRPKAERTKNARQAQQGGVQIVIGDEQLDVKGETSPDTPAAVKAGKLPPPANRFDREITGGSLLQVLDWKSGKNRTGLLAVVTRPSLLYDRLFRTVGQSATMIVAVLAVVVALFGVIELLALFIGVRLTRTITRSVAALYRGTEKVNRGDFSHRIEIQGEDQLAALESSFNSMTASLERLMREQKEKQRLENELAIAQEVQAQLFPRQAAEVPALELHGICRPARTVSGDYYDFLPIESDKVALALGDVSGKGISAALLMATIHSAVRAYSLEAAVVPVLSATVAGGGSGYQGSALAYANGDLSPAALMSLLNRQLYHSTPSEKYATLFFSTYDGHARTLNYCNAGHLPPLVLHTDGSTTRLDVGGTVVGLFDAVNYDETRVTLSPGDIFVAYSDGITEPENDFGEFGEQRLVDLVRENGRLPLARISDLVMAAVLDWIGGAEQPDDMTLVLARPR